LKAVDEFIMGVGLKEMNAEKRRKLAALALHEEEWTQVRLFCNLLHVCFTFMLHQFVLTHDDIDTPKSQLDQHADSAQQAFSAAKVPTLQFALPAIEQLYASWEKASSKSRYDSFVLALNAGMAKLNTYYERSAESDAHIMAMGNVCTSSLFAVC
jgi:hypothetical protein